MVFTEFSGSLYACTRRKALIYHECSVAMTTAFIQDSRVRSMLPNRPSVSGELKVPPLVLEPSGIGILWDTWIKTSFFFLAYVCSRFSYVLLTLSLSIPFIKSLALYLGGIDRKLKMDVPSVYWGIICLTMFKALDMIRMEEFSLEIAKSVEIGKRILPFASGHFLTPRSPEMLRLVLV